MSHREQDAHTTAVQRHNPNSLETVTEALNGAIRNHAAHTVQPCTATLATLDRRVTTAEHDVQSIIEWEDSVICRLIAAEVRITALEAGQPGMNTLAKAHAWQVGVSGVATCRRCGLEVPYTNSLPKTICLCSLPVPADDLEQTNAGLKQMVQTQASDLMQALARAGAAETERDHMLGVLTDVHERSGAQIEVLTKERYDIKSGMSQMEARFNVSEGLRQAIQAEAALGAMVRKMPFCSMLRHDDPEGGGPEWWMQDSRKVGFLAADTPEDVLSEGGQLKCLIDNPIYLEAVKRGKP
jgi:hypothetical protein